MAEEKQYWRSITTKVLRTADADPETDHAEKLNNYLKYGLYGKSAMTNRQIAAMREDLRPMPITYEIEIKHSNTVVYQNSGSMAETAYTTYLCCEDEEYLEKD